MLVMTLVFTLSRVLTLLWGSGPNILPQPLRDFKILIPWGQLLRFNTNATKLKFHLLGQVDN